MNYDYLLAYYTYSVIFFCAFHLYAMALFFTGYKHLPKETGLATTFYVVFQFIDGFLANYCYIKQLEDWRLFVLKMG